MPDMISARDSKPPRLGLSLPWIVGLALLAVPRVVLHDLGIIEEGTFVNGVFVFVPPAVWVAVAVGKRVPRPFVTLLCVGAIYGVLLAVGHQMLWHVSFGDDAPALGGNLSGLDPAVQTVLIRVFAGISSLFTGVLVGAVAGLVAWGIAGLRRGARRTVLAVPAGPPHHRVRHESRGPFVDAQLAADRWKRPLRARGAFADLAAHAYRGGAVRVVKIEALRIDEAVGVADFAAETDRELLIGLTESAVPVAHGLGHPQVTPFVGHARHLHQDAVGLCERLIHRPQRT